MRSEIALMTRRYRIAAVLAFWLIVPSLVITFGWKPLDLRDHIGIRAELDLNTGLMWLDRPLFGRGLGSFIEVYPIYKERHGDLMPYINSAFESYITEAEAAHCDPIQLLAELGIVGFVPFLALVFVALRNAALRIRDPMICAGGIGLVVLLSESLIEYPMQRASTTFLAVFALALAGRGTLGIPDLRLLPSGPSRGHAGAIETAGRQSDRAA